MCLVPGDIVRHYKGGKYEIIGPVKHSETHEDMIVYQNVETGEAWVRPAHMFEDIVEYEGKHQLRFAIHELSPDRENGNDPA